MQGLNIGYGRLNKRSDKQYDTSHEQITIVTHYLNTFAFVVHYRSESVAFKVAGDSCVDYKSARDSVGHGSNLIGGFHVLNGNKSNKTYQYVITHRFEKQEGGVFIDADIVDEVGD